MNILTPTPADLAVNPTDATLLRHLADICEALDIPADRWASAKKAYEALGKILCDPANPLARFKPSVFPQGSARLLTAVRPVRGDEFDIDLICELLAIQGHTVESIFAAVRTAIEANKLYAGRIEIKNRCIRIIFPKEFHLDVTPAIPDVAQGPENILVTDRPSQSLKASNPKGYCDQWFSRIAETPPRIRTARVLAANFEAMLETRADVEPVETPRAMRPVLVRFIQIFKRHRDIAWADDKDAPISAIITTTAAHAYAELCHRDFDSLYDLLLAVARALPSKLGPFIPVQGRSIYTCPNPANPLENYADKWVRKPQRQDAFFAWQQALVAYLTELRALAGAGADIVHRKLAAGFGEDIVHRVTIERAQALKRQSAKGAIGVSVAGLILPKKSAAVVVQPQTFHGGGAA